MKCIGHSVADPRCLSPIPDPDFLPIPDLGSRISDPGSRIPDRGSRIADPGSRIPDLGSRISDPGSRIPDLGSRIPDPNPNPDFWGLGDNFLGKNFNNSWKIGPNFFLRHIKNKIIFSFVKFVATKNGLTKKIFVTLQTSNFLILFLSWGKTAWIRIPDPNSKSWEKIVRNEFSWWQL